jgi:hypothetical protein
MKELNIHNWTLEVNVKETYDQYKNAKWDLCDCTDCLNFFQAMKTISSELFDLFNSLGIIPSKCVHLSEFGPTENGLHLYMGCYHIVGRIKKGKPVDTNSWDEHNVAEIDNFSFVFSNDLIFVPGSMPSPVLQMDFSLEIPWVLKEPYGK